MNWNDILVYENGELFWKVTLSSRAIAGGRVGSLNGDGYLCFNYKRKSHKVHRVIWEMHNGPIPKGMQVDHIDHNRVNNLLSNFRLVDSKTNSRNQKKRVTNSSGVTGVYWHKRDSIWYAAISDGTRLVSLGTFAEKQDTIDARKAAEKLYGYHPNHGAS